MSDTGGDKAWVTLATNDSYALGALVLARSLRRVNTCHQLVLMATSSVSASMRNILSQEFNSVVDVNLLDSEDTTKLALMSRPDLGVTFTKLHCWKLTQYSKCVFMDADTMVIQNADELFDREELSAAPDSGWPDCFNSGVYVFKPSLETYNNILQLSVEKGSFDGGDQGLLNLYFSDWSHADISKHLPYIYNMCASAVYTYLPAYRMYGQNAKIVHFLGASKPWLAFYDSSTATARAPVGQEHLQELLQAWWDLFRVDVHPKLTPDMGGGSNDKSVTVMEQKGLAGAFASLSLEGQKTEEQAEYESQMRKHAWESGHIDYMGKDSFENIMKKIQENMPKTGAPGKKSPSPAKEVKVEPQATEEPKAETPQVTTEQPPPATETPKATEEQPPATETPKATEEQPPTTETPKATEEQPPATETAKATEQPPPVVTSETQPPPVTESAPIPEVPVTTEKKPEEEKPKTEEVQTATTTEIPPVVQQEIVPPQAETQTQPPVVEAGTTQQPQEPPKEETKQESAAAPKTEEPKVEETPKIEEIPKPPETEAPKAEEIPKVETTKAEEIPKAEPPKTEEIPKPPETEPQKTDAPPVSETTQQPTSPELNQEEREALEKKLAEQKRTAEQKLQQELAQQQTTTESQSQPEQQSATAAAATTETDAPPQAPPRKQSKGEEPPSEEQSTQAQSTE